MALTRDEKERILGEYAQEVGRAQVMVWANYRGLRTPRMAELRRLLRPTGARSLVVKNTLMRLALERSGLPVNPDLARGTCMVTFIGGDVAASTKTLGEFARLNEASFSLIGGIVGGRLATADQIRSLSMLPPREVLLGQLLGGLQAPITGFVGTLAAVMRGLVTVLQERAKQLEGSPS